MGIAEKKRTGRGGLAAVVLKINRYRVPIVARQVKNSACILEDADLIPGLDQWVKDPASPQSVL